MSDQGSPPSDPFEPPREGGTPPGGDQPGYYGGQGTQQPGYGNPQFGQPQYGQPQYGQPQYGQPQYGQPQYGYGAPGGAPPQNYLVWAILATVFCCLPLGIASIVFAAQVNGKWAAGDHAGARDASEKAKKFAIWSAGVSVILFAGIIALAAVGTVSNS
jgi:hypothetical protein